MGRRDYRHREPKKAKKTAKKLPSATLLPMETTVEVIKKKRKREEEEEGA